MNDSFGISKRAIKFRAWDKDGGMKHITSFLSFGRTGEFSSVEDNEDVVLMQFTGLLDKHGKEIYEGDIVVQGEPSINRELLLVRWHQNRFIATMDNVKTDALSFSYDSSFTFMDWHRLEVIGNVFEDKNLLK